MKLLVWKTRFRYLLFFVLKLFLMTLLLMGLQIALEAFITSGSFPSFSVKLVQVAIILLSLAYSLLILFEHRYFLLPTKKILAIIEESHPGLRNDLTTLDYLDSHPEECRELGYSTGMITRMQVEYSNWDSVNWNSLKLTTSHYRNPIAGGILGLLLIILASGMFTKQDIWNKYLFPSDILPQLAHGSFNLPIQIRIPLSKPVLTISTGSVYADLNIPEDLLLRVKETHVYIREADSNWKHLLRIPQTFSENRSPIAVPISKDAKLVISLDGCLSNPIEVLRIPPPAVDSFHVHLRYPEYSGKREETRTNINRVDTLTGTELTLSWEIPEPVESATFELISASGAQLAASPLDVNDPYKIQANFLVAGNGSIRIAMKDSFNQVGFSPELRFNEVPDQVPNLLILSPTREIILPDSLQVPVEILAEDDIGLSEVTLVSRREGGGESKSNENRQTLYTINPAGSSIPAASHHQSITMDLSSLSLWPGDRVLYWLEAKDWRGILPGKSGRSEIHIIRFPTIEERMEETTALRSQTTDGLNEILDEQQQINRQFKELRQELQQDMNRRGRSSDNQQNQKQLKETIQRQEQVQEKLSELANRLEDSLKRLEEESDFSLNTLQKFERVQELLDQILSDESKRVLQELQETLKKLDEQQLNPEELQQTEENLAEFEKQLDRQIALLEKIWLEQKTEELKKHAEELADRQQDLLEATDQMRSASENITSSSKENQGIHKDLLALKEQVEEMMQQAKQDPHNQETSSDQQPPQESAEDNQSQQETSNEKSENSPEDPVLSDRQEQLNKDTEAFLNELKRLREKAQEQNQQLSEKLDKMKQEGLEESLSDAQQSALNQLRKGQFSKASQKQQKARQELLQMAEGLSECCSGNDQEENIERMRLALDRAFFLSENGEKTDKKLSRYKGLASWPNPQKMSQIGREMGLYQNESSRLSKELSEVAKSNPFADFSVIKHFDQATKNWKENTSKIEEVAPLTVSLKSHSALAQINLAIEKLIDSLQQTQSQSTSANAMDGYFKSLKKMLSKQRGINQQTEQMQKEGKSNSGNQRLPNPQAEQSGEGMDTFRKMAQEQASVRRQLEALERQYQNMKQRTGSLEGISEMMKDVEKELQHGNADQPVRDLQTKIEQRLLDAEKSLHNQGFLKKRRALRAEGEGLSPNYIDPYESPTKTDQEDLVRLLQPDLTSITPQWRDRIRSYYSNLLKNQPR